MQETIDTRGNFSKKEIPDGKNTFRIMKFKKNEKMYIFTLAYDGDQEGEQVFFSGDLGPLLKVLGCKESEKGVYILDTDEVIGSPFTATVYREPNKKDLSKVYQKMKEFDEVPF